MKRIISSVFAAAMTIALGVMSAMADDLPTFYVAKTGNDTTGNGSKDNPYLTVDTAVAAVKTAGSGVIYVGEGTYTVTQISTRKGNAAGDPHFSLFIYGESKDPTKVVFKPMSGGNKRILGIFDPSISNNAYDFEISSITLTGCSFSGSGAGAGAAATVAHGRIANCIICGNTDTRTQTKQHGGILCISGQTTVENCLFYNNNVGNNPGPGADIFITTVASGVQAPKVINCTFIANSTKVPVIGCKGSTTTSTTFADCNAQVINCAVFANDATKRIPFYGSNDTTTYINCVADFASDNFASRATGFTQTTMAAAMDENYYPIALSPMIGGGSISYYQANAVSTVDLAGNARIVKEGTQLDIGCYQTDGTIPGPERPDDPTEPDDPPDDPTSGYAEHAGTPGTIGSLEYAPASVFANYAYTASPKQCKIAPKIFTDGNGNTFLTYQILNMDGVDVFSGFYISRWDAENNVWGEPKKCAVGDPVAEQRTSGQKKSVAYPEYVGYHNGKWYVFGNTTMYNDTLTTLYQTYEDNKPFAWPVYMTFDPEQGDFTSCEPFDFPIENYAFAYPFEQVVWKENGNVLIPFYYSLKNDTKNYKVVVVEYSVDASTGKPTVATCGKTIDASAGYSIGEPSLVKYGSKYYITIRLNDDDNTKPNKSGIWAVSDDGLNFSSPVEWNWDSDDEFFNMSTQQHWVKVGGELYLVYTRDNGSNSDILRHRAPLYMAKFDTEKGLLLKATEQAIVPKRGARLGNFYVSDISENEQWLITAEWMQNSASQPINPGAVAADNSLWIVRINDEIDETKVSAKVLGYSGDVDGEAHACEVNVIYPTSGYTVKWAWNDTEDFIHDAPESYTEAGVYTNRVKVMASDMTDFIGQAVVTLEEYVEPIRPKYYMVGNDSNGKFALNGGRDNAWTNEAGTASKNIDSMGDYVVDGNNTIYPNNNSFTFAGHSLTFTANATDQKFAMSAFTNQKRQIDKLVVDGNLTFNSGTGDNVLTGETWVVNGKLAVTPSCGQGKSSPFTFAAPLFGAGEFAVNYVNYDSSIAHRFLITRDVSGFTGKVTLSANAANAASSDNTYIEFTEDAKFFGEAATPATNSVEVSYVRLVFDDDVTSDKNRGWTFKSRVIQTSSGGRTYNHNQIPVIYVAEGKTVTIKGPVTFESIAGNPSAAGKDCRLIKQGKGKLVFKDITDANRKLIYVEEGELGFPLGVLIMAW